MLATINISAAAANVAINGTRRLPTKSSLSGTN
jgi:hypothetical protein